MAEGYHLQELIREVAGIVVEENRPDRIFDGIAPALKQFAESPAGLPDHVRRASGGQTAIYLLHEEGDRSFFIVAVATPPGADSGIHSHSGWAISVVLEGAEEETLYRRANDGAAVLELAETGQRVNRQDDVTWLQAEEFHRLRNRGDATILSIDVLAGRPETHRRNLYDPAQKTVHPVHYRFAPIHT